MTSNQILDVRNAYQVRNQRRFQIPLTTGNAVINHIYESDERNCNRWKPRAGCNRLFFYIFCISFFLQQYYFWNCTPSLIRFIFLLYYTYVSIRSLYFLMKCLSTSGISTVFNFFFLSTDRQNFIQLKYREKAFVQKIEDADVLLLEAMRELNVEKAYKFVFSYQYC